MESLDLGAVIGSVFSFAIYHVCTYSSVFCLHNDHVQLSRNVSNSLHWVQKHREFPDPASVTLAVQTLRNTILVSIFVGGSAFQYGFFFLNTEPSGIRGEVRAVILSTLLFSSFLCWAGTIRYANHLGFSVGTLDMKIKEVLEIEKQEKEKLDSLRAQSLSQLEEQQEISSVSSRAHGSQTDANGKLSYVAVAPHTAEGQHRTISDIMDGMNELCVSMSTCFSLGFRFLFVSIPFAFYSAGPIALIVASAVMLIFLFEIDHVEKSTYNVMAGFSRRRKI